MKKEHNLKKEYLEDIERKDAKDFDEVSKLDKSAIPSKDHMTKQEKLINELEGQRQFEHGSYKYWFIALVSFLWSLFQLFVVMYPINDVFLRAIHLGFAVLLAYALYPIIRKPSLRSTITWYYRLYHHT